MASRQKMTDITMREPEAVAAAILRNNCPDVRLARVLLEMRRLLPHSAWRLFHAVWPTLTPSGADESLILDNLRRLAARTPGADHLSGPDRAVFDRLPDTLTIYRGAAQEHVSGLVWTMDRQQAETHARAARNGLIAEGIILKRDTFGFYADRGEVLVDPDALDVLARAALTGDLLRVAPYRKHPSELSAKRDTER